MREIRKSLEDSFEGSKEISSREDRELAGIIALLKRMRKQGKKG